MLGTRWVALLLITGGVLGAAYAETGDTPVTGAHFRQLGLEARLDPAVRDARVQAIATLLRNLPAEQLHEFQEDIQFALLLQCDPEIYDTLAPETIAAVDQGLEALFSLEEVERSNHWEPLIYVYGFFNRDVTPDAIRDIIGAWDRLSDAEKAPRYPTYIHVIDAVTKPLSMGPLADAAMTREAMGIVVPALKAQFLLPPAPGTAFHPPSHACLVLGPLFERWYRDTDHGALVREHLGNRTEFEALMVSQLPGAPGRVTPLPELDYGYYAYIGSYLANALARMDARSAVPALRRSLAIYEAHGARGRVVAYTQRALLALADPEARAAFAAQLTDPAKREEHVATAVWLARNGQGETAVYGREKLGELLQCPPADALTNYFTMELHKLKE